MATVLAFGCFDILHFGHLKFLEKAKLLGSRLTVVVARDRTAERIKGRKPVFDEKARLEMLRALKIVDSAILGNKGGNKYAVIRKVGPHAIALGYDQREDEARLRKWLDSNGMRKTRLVRIRHIENEEAFKSSKALNRLRHAIEADL